MRKGWKLASLAAMGGLLLQFGGCIGALITSLLVSVGAEFLVDNGAFIDIFCDSGSGRCG